MQPVNVANPFVWLTKAEVVARIAAHGFADLIRDTRSCTRVHEMTRLHPHCGQCSQCLDRRFAILEAGQAHEDPDEAYKVDLFTGERPPGPDREMALAYVRSASDVNRMADVAFFSRFGEASRAVDFFDEPAGVVAERIFNLHRRHAAAVCTVFDQAVSQHASALREQSLPTSSFLALVVGQREQKARSPAADPASQVEAGPSQGGPREVRIALDESGKRVVFQRWGELKGANAELIVALAETFRKAVRAELGPERYPFTKTATLLREVDCNDEETLRRRIHRCRTAIQNLAAKAGDPPPPIDAVIENSPWHGYRLNPDCIRIVAHSELRDAR